MIRLFFLEKRGAGEETPVGPESGRVSGLGLFPGATWV